MIDIDKQAAALQLQTAPHSSSPFAITTLANF